MATSDTNERSPRDPSRWRIRCARASNALALLALASSAAAPAVGASSSALIAPPLTSPLPAAGAPQDDGASARAADAKSKLEETRLALAKWIETQQIIARERKDWQQSREILEGRVELLRKEVAALEAKIQEKETAVADANKKRDELLADNEALKTTGAQLAGAATSMEGEVRKLMKSVPEPLRAAPAVLLERMPADPATTKVSAAERFQNVLGILNALNKANTEITVNFEVHTLASGRSSEVRAIYVGLGQAYYVSADGEAGIGRPTAEGWKWEPANAIAPDVLIALEILQNKHSPAFVPLPVTIQ